MSPKLIKPHEFSDSEPKASSLGPTSFIIRNKASSTLMELTKCFSIFNVGSIINSLKFLDTYTIFLLAFGEVDLCRLV